MLPETQPRKILVVDDEQLIRRLTQTVLESVGFQVVTAPGGAEALDLYRQQAEDIDLVLLDLAMPEMSGEEVLQELCRFDPQVKVVICSAHAGADSHDLIENGARGIVPKPYRVEQLLRCIEQALTPIAG